MDVAFVIEPRAGGYAEIKVLAPGVPVVCVSDGAAYATLVLDRTEMIDLGNALLAAVKTLDDARRGHDPAWFALAPPTVHQTPDE